MRIWPKFNTSQMRIQLWRFGYWHQLHQKYLAIWGTSTTSEYKANMSEYETKPSLVSTLTEEASSTARSRPKRIWELAEQAHTLGHQALIVTLHRHDPDGFSLDAHHSDPAGAAGSYTNVWYSGSSCSEKSSSLSSCVPKEKRVLELPVSGTGIFCQELSAGLKIARPLWFFHSTHKSFSPRTAWAVTITHPFLTSLHTWLLGSYTSTKRELPIVKLERPPMT